MQPLLSTPGDFLAPAPSGTKSVGTSPAGEESFAKHLASETARESTDDADQSLVNGTEMASSATLQNQTETATESQLYIAQNSADIIDQILASQQSQQANTPITQGTKNKDASPLMVLLEKLSTRQDTPTPLTGDTKSVTVNSAATQTSLQKEGNTQPQKTSALQQQLAALSESVLAVQRDATSPKADTLQSAPQGTNVTTPTAAQLQPVLSPVATPSQLNTKTATVVTVEQWSATFKPVQAQALQTENTAVVSSTAKGEQVIHTENGQTITLYQSSENEEMAVATPLAARASTVDYSGQRQDANSNYIHSNLPNNSVKTALGTEVDQQSKNSGDQQLAAKNMSTASELGTELRAGTETAPVSFTLDNAVPPLSTPTSPATSPGANLMKLPSGATFYESAVVDQVIDHFSGAKKLESGSIRLQLHPQELGELRMEIEVKQDNVKAHITAQNPQAQEALDRHLPRLRETLAQQGLHLNEVEITVAAGEQYQGNQFQQNNARHQLGQSYRQGTKLNTNTSPITETEVSTANESKQGLSVTV